MLMRAVREPPLRPGPFAGNWRLGPGARFVMRVAIAGGTTSSPRDLLPICVVGAVREPPSPVMGGLLMVKVPELPHRKLRTMPYDPEIHHRRSIRLRHYDYSQPGSYFVTICTEKKEHLFGQVVEGEMHRNERGDRIARCWNWLAQQYPYIVMDEWTIMPNHLHGIIVITGEEGGSRTAPTGRKTLGRLVGAFKTVSTGDLNELRATPIRTLWQRDFYDHIIRNQDELNKIREYIRTNPLQWSSDPDFTQKERGKDAARTADAYCKSSRGASRRRYDGRKQVARSYSGPSVITPRPFVIGY